MAPFLRSAALSRWSALVTAVLCLLGCDDPETPGRGRGYHRHRLVIYSKVVNSAADTIGVASGSLEMSTLLIASRPSLWFDMANLASSGGVVFGPAPVIDLAPPDTEFRACTTEVDHLIGYQLHYDGDTTRLCALDRHDGWEAMMHFMPGRAVLRSGDTIGISTMTRHNFPDTIRAGRDIEIEMVFDMDGLITRCPNPAWLSLDVDKIAIRQR
jgi:hypothetical protein